MWRHMTKLTPLLRHRPYVNDLADDDIKLPAVDQQSMLIYVDSVTHNYHVDAEFYKDYFHQFSSD